MSFNLIQYFCCNLQEDPGKKKQWKMEEKQPLQLALDHTKPSWNLFFCHDYIARSEFRCSLKPL